MSRIKDIEDASNQYCNALKNWGHNRITAVSTIIRIQELLEDATYQPDAYDYGDGSTASQLLNVWFATGMSRDDARKLAEVMRSKANNPNYPWELN